MTDTRDTMLSKAMLENALFSGASGLILIIGAALGLDDWLGINAWLLVGLGVGLVIYAIDLSFFARSPRWLIPGGRMAVAADVAWVIAAVALIAFTAALSDAGEVALAAVSLIVAGFAVAQWIGLRRIAVSHEQPSV